MFPSYLAYRFLPNLHLFSLWGIKALQAQHHALSLHLHHASAITLSKIKCVLHVMPHYIFARLQGNL